MSITAAPAAKRTCGSSRRAIKRATYRVHSRRRVLFTVATEEAIKLIDTPAEHYESAVRGLATTGTFIVEPQLPDDAQELEAIISDYLEQAALHSRVPMTFSRLGDFLSALAE